MKSFAIVLLALAGIAAGETKLGKPLALREPIGIDKLVTAKGDKYVGKTVQVKGRATDVCRLMGCWMEVADPGTGKSVRVKVSDGQVVFPKDAIGKMVVVEGKFTRIDLSKEEAVARARHEAEENGRKFDPASIKSAQTTYEIQGTGAVILE